MRYYLSHSIQGKYGRDATPSQMKANCDRVLLVAAKIREALPSIELYVPAEHEDFVATAYRDKYLTIGQILEIDCKIIDTLDGVIVFTPLDDPIQGGRLVEYDHAIATNKPVVVFEYIWQAVEWLTHQIVRA